MAKLRYFIVKWIVILLCKLRWFYFHVSPMYVKFYMDLEMSEAYFQNINDGSLHSNFKWVDDNE